MSSKPQSPTKIQDKQEHFVELKANIVFHILSAQFKESTEEDVKKLDPYVKIKIGDVEFKTQVAQVALNQGLNPVWNYQNKIYVSDFDSMLNLEICEWDKTIIDESPATAKISLMSALNHEGKEFTLEVIRKGINFGYVVLKVEDMQKLINKAIWADNTQVKALQKYLQQNGLSKSCQVIFSEILSRDIPKQHVFAYTALRLRQIGSDLEVIRKQPSSKEDKILDMINE